MEYLQNDPLLLPIFQELEQLTQKDLYNLWLKPTRFVYNPPVLNIYAPNEFWKNILVTRFETVIKELFLKHTQTAIQVVYHILPPSQPAQTKEQRALEASAENNTPEIPVSSSPRVNFAARLNSEYTFDNFIESPSNRFAYKASQAVGQKLGNRAHNPLFIYSAPGLGKTHLLHAIGNQILQQNPQAKVLYMSGEEFVSECVQEILNNNGEIFRQKYRSLDCFLMDDIQFVVGKNRSEQEFFYTFNALFESGKQIVLSSDRTPQQLEMDERYASRLLSGIVTEIKRPDWETRLAILRKKSEALHFIVGEDVLVYIAEGIQTNIRELEGALLRLRAYCEMQGIPPSISIAKEILGDVLTNEKEVPVSVNTIKKIVAKHYNIRMEDFTSKRKTQSIAWPRQIAMFLATEITDLSLPEIGREFNRDHSTVLHARDLVRDKIQGDPFFAAEVNQIVLDVKDVDKK